MGSSFFRFIYVTHMWHEMKRERERESFKWPFGIYFGSNQNQNPIMHNENGKKLEHYVCLVMTYTFVTVLFAIIF